MPTLFREIAELCEEFEATRKRLHMVKLASDFIKRLNSDEVEPAVSMILGRPLPKWGQNTMDVSWATLRDVILRLVKIRWKAFSEAFAKTGDIGSATKILFEQSRIDKQATLFEKKLTILEVRRSFEAISKTTGPGSKDKKERLVEMLLSVASPLEAKYLVKMVIGEMRTGFHEGLMEQAVSTAFEISMVIVQKAGMVIGDIGQVAALAKVQGGEALLKADFKVLRPVKLMLAQTANDVAEALKEHDGETAFEYKLDGVRVQIHKKLDDVRIFSRRLTDTTASLPEIVEAVLDSLKAKEAIVEGEVIAVDSEGHPIPFQHLMRRFRRIHQIADTAKRIPVELYLFDILYVDGKNVISTSYSERRQLLKKIADGIPLIKQLITSEVGEAESFLAEAISLGHEGLVSKKLDGDYVPGVRGKRWLKVKPVLEPLDLVIVAAEYGYGRRHEWLSDYHLAARDAETGEFLKVGKTFKGLRDAEIIEMTRQLKEISVRVEGRRIVVIPKIVVEVLYNEIQKSTKYRSGMALRFARISRIRTDKAPEEADTIQRVQTIFDRQFLKKGRYKP